MGGSVGVERRDKDVMALFVDDRLLKGEQILKRNPNARLGFVKFIESGVWTENLAQFEDSLLTKLFNDESVWTKYGYNSPKCSSPTKPMLSGSGRSASDRSFDFTCVETVCTARSICQLMIVTDFRDHTSLAQSSRLFKVEELRSVLYASLLPIYLNSPEYRHLRNKSGGELVRNNTSDTFPATSDKLRLETRSERLQQWLLSAAALCNKTQLDSHLSDPESSWIEEYTNILRNLPVTVYLSMVSDEEVESKVVYCNCSDKVLFKERSAIGTNLHEIFSLRCSAHEADQVHRAVFGGKPLKLCLMTDACTLRALKPVHDAEGQLKYMIGIESQPFAYPVEADSFASEQPFQQVEDLLTLLPLLVKDSLFSR